MAASEETEMSESIDLEAQGNLYVLLNAITDKGFELPSEKAQKARL